MSTSNHRNRESWLTYQGKPIAHHKCIQFDQLHCSIKATCLHQTSGQVCSAHNMLLRGPHTRTPLLGRGISNSRFTEAHRAPAGVAPRRNARTSDMRTRKKRKWARKVSAGHACGHAWWEQIRGAGGWGNILPPPLFQRACRVAAFIHSTTICWCS